MYKADRVSISNSTNYQPLCIPSSSSINVQLAKKMLTIRVLTKRLE